MGTKKRLKKLKARVKLLVEIGLQATIAGKEAESTAQSALALVDKLTRRVQRLEADTPILRPEGSSVPFCVECGAPMAEALQVLRPTWVCSTNPASHPVRRRERPSPEASFKSCGPEEP